MTTTYPTPVPALIEQVRELVKREGVVPSRNRIMAEFRVGAAKANQALAALTEPTPNPPTTAPPRPTAGSGTAVAASPTTCPHRN